MYTFFPVMFGQRWVLLRILPAAAELPSPSMGIASQRLAISALPPFIEYNLQPQLLMSIMFEILAPAWSRVSLSNLAVEYPNWSYEQNFGRSGHECSLGHSRRANHLGARRGWAGGWWCYRKVWARRIVLTDPSWSVNTGVNHSKEGEWPQKRDYRLTSMLSGFGDEVPSVFDMVTYWQSGHTQGKSWLSQSETLLCPARGIAFRSQAEWGVVKGVCTECLFHVGDM